MRDFFYAQGVAVIYLQLKEKAHWLIIERGKQFGTPPRPLFGKEGGLTNNLFSKEGGKQVPLLGAKEGVDVTRLNFLF